MVNQEKVFRKGIIVMIITFMVFSTLSVFAATDTFTISGELISNNDIEQGDIFIYKLTVKNSSANDINDVEAKISGDFVTVNGLEVDYGSILVGESLTIDIAMKYTGTSDQMNIYVHDADGNASVKNVNLSNATTTDDQQPSKPVDKDRFYPNFNLVLNNIPIFNSGQESTFTFELENITAYHGKDVQVQLINDSSNFPFNDMTNPLITVKRNFGNKEKKELSMQVITKESVISGFYNIPVVITYNNVYGLPKSINKDIQVEVVNSNILPSLVVDEVKIKTEKLIPGEENYILLNLKNTGSIDVKYVDVVLKGLDVNGVYLRADSVKKSIASIDAQDSNFITYKVFVSDEIKTNQHEMSLDVKYFDQYGKEYSETLPVYIPVENLSNNIYDIDINVTSFPPKVIAGNEFVIRFDIENTSYTNQKNLKLSIKSDGNFIYKSQPVIIIDNLEASEVKSFEFKMITDDNMATNNYPMYITIENSDVSLSDSVIEYIGIFVDGETGVMSKPKIIIDAYDFGGNFVLAGQEFDMDITFFNTSNTIGIQNAKVSLVIDESAFVPVGAASSFYIDKIGIKEKVTKTIKMKAKADLNVKTYNVTTEIEYEDGNGNSYDVNENPYTASESMAIPVMQELRLEIEDITMPEIAFAYQPFELYVEFFNMGKSTLSNMLVSTEGDFEVQDGKFFVGNFGPGINEYYSCNIIPTNVGSNSGKVIFEFEDAIGEKHSVTKEIVFEVMEAQTNIEGSGGGAIDFGEETFVVEEKKSPVKTIIILVVIVMFIVSIIVILIKRKKRKQREMELDE